MDINSIIKDIKDKECCCNKAAHISKHAGRCWMVFSCCGRNFIMSAKEGSGDWQVPVELNDTGACPYFFHDEDGLQYFLNAHKSDDDVGYISLQQYSHYRDKLVGEQKIIYNGCACQPRLYNTHGAYYLVLKVDGQDIVLKSDKIDEDYTVVE